MQVQGRYVFIIILFVLTLQISAQDTVRTEILNRVNIARQENGVAALVFNEQLQSAAQEHSDDMAVAGQLSHVGTDGSQFWERMQEAGYTLIAGAENILSRGDTDPERAFRQWFNSQSHRENMLNGDYVDVGIAYTRAESGRFYFTMVLGRSADTVTLMVSPTNTILASNTALPTNTTMPSNTPIPPTATITPTIPPAPSTIPTVVQTLTPVATISSTATTRPIQAIVTNTALPTATEYIAPDIHLIYDENSFLMINVSGRVLNLADLVFESESGTMPATRWNTQFLSQPLSGFTNRDCLQAWILEVTYLNTPANCRYRHAWIAVTNDAVFWRNADIFIVRNGEDLVGVCLLEAGECEVNISTIIEDISVIDPLVFGQIPDLRLEYPDSSFTLTNIAGRTLDLTGLIFRSESGTLAIEEWDNGFLSQPLYSFANGGCLQAWTPDYPNQSAPERCEIRHAWILVNDSGDFWRQTDNFTVERNGILIRRCSTDQTQCTVSLSANFGEVDTP